MSFPTEAEKFYALGVQFEDVGKSDGKICVNDVLKVSPAYGRDEYDGRADQIQVWTGMGWDKYFFHKTLNGFVKVVGVSDEGKITTDTVSAGDTIFFIRSSKGENGDVVTLSGGITRIADKISIAVAPERFYFAANPWPVPMTIASIKTMVKNASGESAIYGRDEYDGRADQIQVWNGMGWDYYFYHKTLEGFVKLGDETKVTEETIGVGKGFFFIRSSKGEEFGDKLEFTKPAGL